MWHESWHGIRPFRTRINRLCLKSHIKHYRQRKTKTNSDCFRFMFSVLERIKLEYRTSSTHTLTFVIVFALSFASMKKKTRQAYNRTNEERKNGVERKRTKGTERERAKKMKMFALNVGISCIKSKTINNRNDNDQAEKPVADLLSIRCLLWWV